MHATTAVRSLTIVAVGLISLSSAVNTAGQTVLDESTFQEINCRSPEHQGQSCWLLSFGGTEIAQLQLDLRFPLALEVSNVQFTSPLYAGSGVPILQFSGNQQVLRNIGVKWNPPAGTDLVYDPETGGFSVVTSEILTTLEIISKSRIFTGDAAQNLGGQWDVDRDDKLFKLLPEGFRSLDFGRVAPPDLTAEFLAQDLLIDGSRLAGGELHNVDIREPSFSTVFEVELFDPRQNLGPRLPVEFTLLASDANDYIGFTNATERRGPGQIAPIRLTYRCDVNGDSVCTSDDIDALSDGIRADTLLVYHPVTGGLSVQTKVPLSTLEIISQSSIFNGNCQGLDGLFDVCRPDKIFKLGPDGFGSSYLGNVTRPGLSVRSLKNDIRFDGSPLAGGKPNIVGPVIDLNNDGQLNAFDRKGYVEEILGTFFGDSNLDGEFNSGDLISVFVAGEYEDARPGNSTWAEGDWNGDRDFDSADLILAFVADAYEKGPRVALAGAAVPEASSYVLLSMGLLCGLALRDRKRTKYRNPILSHDSPS
jgi:hypothetical protein